MLKEEELQQALSLFTDRFGAMMDQYNKGRRLFFRCSHSGLFFPENYGKDWGRLFGVGLGPHPVSEILNTDYDTPPDVRPEVRTENIMHPMEVTAAQVDGVMLHPYEVKGAMAVLQAADMNLDTRSAILLKKQWTNPRGKLQRYRPDLVARFGAVK